MKTQRIVKNAEQPEDCSASRIESRLLHAVFVCLDHLLDHLAADRAGLTAGELTVITVLQVDADFGGGPATILKSPCFAVRRACWRWFRAFLR
jgi:hypothetical protein